MWNFLLLRSTPLLVLLASVAVAKDREPRVRNAYFSGGPDEKAQEVYVTGQVVTVLRFLRPCVEAGTKLLGWEGRWSVPERRSSSSRSRTSSPRIASSCW
jgi:Protein of unknown function (DUF2381)